MLNYKKKILPKENFSKEKIAKFLKSVEHKLDFPSYYYGNELNTVHKEWTDQTTAGLFVNPVNYDAGINGLGVNILYQQVNDIDPINPEYEHLKEIYNIQTNIPAQIAERAYMPDNRLYNYLKDAEMPTIFGVESKRSWKEFDWLGFSIYFELQFFNMVAMMYDSGMPLYSRERIALPDNDVTPEQERETPIVCIGGISAYCSEGISELYDFAMIGDGEAQIPKICELVTLYKQGVIQTKLGLLKRIAKEVPGCYVPLFYEWEHEFGVRMPLSYKVLPEYEDIAPKVVTKALFDITKLPPFHKQLLPQCEENLLGYANIEVNRGCHNFCRFCKASACHKPVREHTVDAIMEAVKETPKYEGAQNITPYSLNYTGFTQKNLLAYRALTESQKGFTTSTQRVDTFSVPLAKTLHELGDKGSTFAIESGSQKMRNVINKEITDEQILSAVKSSIDIGYSSMKFYMISCLPWETDEDRMQIVYLMRDIVQYMKDTNKRVRIRLSFTPFTACPHTPLQYADCSDWDDKLDPVYEELRKLDLYDQRSISDNNHFLMQLMNRTDRRFNDIIVDAVLNYGIVYNDRHIKKGYDILGLFNDLCKKYTGLEVLDFLKEIPVDAVLPWEVMSNGISKEWLKQEYLKAKAIGLETRAVASATNLKRAGVPYEKYEGAGLLTEQGNPKMWVNTNIKIIKKEDMPEGFVPLDTGLTPSCMKTCNQCGVCQNPDIKKQGGKMALYHLQLKDIPEQQLLDKMKEPEPQNGFSKLLIEFRVLPESRYIPQSKYKLLLKSAFAFAEVNVKEKMEILSETIPFDNVTSGKDLAMMRTLLPIEKVTKEQLDIINSKLDGILHIDSIKVYPPDLAGIKQLAEYKLYKVYLRLPGMTPEEVAEKLNFNNHTIKMKQRCRGDKQGRTAYEELETEIPLMRAIPLKTLEDGSTENNAYKVYFALPYSTSPYDFLKEILGYKNKRELFKYPIDCLALFKIPDRPSVFNPACKCKNYKEVDIFSKPLCNSIVTAEAKERYKAEHPEEKVVKTNKCISCLIKDNLI